VRTQQDLLLFLCSALGTIAVPTLEALNTTTSIDKLLSTGVKRMALVTQLDVEIRFRGTGHKGVPTRAVHGSHYIIWMDVALHIVLFPSLTTH
jgi:hypothetical protein